MVIDNLDNVSILKGYLPENSSGRHTVITTRNQDTFSIPAEGLEVGTLPPDDAAELLCNRSRMSQSPEIASLIVADLGYLPLAIERAAAYIREASKDMFAFQTTYIQNRRAIHSRIPYGNQGYSSSVSTT